MPSQIVSGNHNGPVPSITVYRDAFVGASATTNSSTLLANANVFNFPTAGVVSKFTVILDTAPGVGCSRTFTLYLNGSSTSVSVTISGTDKVGVDLSNTLSVSAGDSIQIYASYSGAVAATYIKHSAIFTPDTDYEYIFGGFTSANAALNRYLYFGGVNNAGSATESDTNIVMPCAGTIKKLFIRTSTAPGGTDTLSVTARKNGVSQTLVATITGTETYAQDTSNSFTVAAGDNLTFLVGGTRSRGSLTWSFVFVPSTTTDIPHFTAAMSNFFVTSQYANLDHSYNSTCRGTGTYQLKSERAVAMYVTVKTAPGTGTSKIFTLTKNGSATDLVVTISGTNTTGNATGSVSVADGDVLSIVYSVSGSPVASVGSVSLVFEANDSVITNQVMNIIINC